MDERHAVSAAADARLGVDELGPRGFQSLERRFDVRDADRDVVQPLAAILDELGDRRLVVRRLEELEVGVGSMASVIRSVSPRST
jgi:hypothetical protein